ncbi:MAG: PD-(D/E)XK nuclease family protein, partial [Pseudomonadota bacterium]|nr:PD-(D/E)XK nuclease family protein [Pseudomonadota bacterium]
DRSVAVLARVGGEVLDDALDEAGFARLGFSSASVWRPVFQVLPLVMELLWEPLDPRPLLQFLSHPVAPITARVRTRLAEAVSEEPGIGGGKWLASIETALEEQKQAGKNDRELDTLRTAIDFWLHNDRYPPAAGTPLEGIRQRAKMVRDWLAASTPVQASDVSRSLFNAAYGQAEELIGALDRLQAGGSTMISRETLRRLIESTRSSGAGRPDKQAECIPGEQQLLRADDPSGFIGPVPVVVWWGCGRESLPANYPWSITEQRHLAQNGIRLQPVEEKLGWQADSWLRPILAATDRLLLVFHADAESHHPVWDRIAAIAEGWVEADILSLAQTPSSGSSLVEQPETEPLTVNPLPGFSRWWQLPDGKGLSRRESESYSSLEKFLFGPYQWVLNYKARLRKGALAEVSDGNLLKGNLAHMLFEWFFNAHTDLSLVERSAAEAWARRELPGLIEQSGAMLLAPGRQHERESFLSVVTRALGALREWDVHAQQLEARLRAGRAGGGRAARAQ